MRAAILVCVIALGFVSVSAQSAPYMLTFTASASHDVIEHAVPVVDRYELIVTAQGQATPVATVDLRKPAPGAQQRVVVDVSDDLRDLPVGAYTATIRTVGPGGDAVSAGSDPFALTVSAPAAAGQPGVSR